MYVLVYPESLKFRAWSWIRETAPLVSWGNYIGWQLESILSVFEAENNTSSLIELFWKAMQLIFTQSIVHLMTDAPWNHIAPEKIIIFRTFTCDSRLSTSSFLSILNEEQGVASM